MHKFLGLRFTTRLIKLYDLHYPELAFVTYFINGEVNLILHEVASGLTYYSLY